MSIIKPGELSQAFADHDGSKVPSDYYVDWLSDNQRRVESMRQQTQQQHEVPSFFGPGSGSGSDNSNDGPSFGG